MGTILIIDHDDENRSALKTILGERYSLILAESLKSGSDVLEKTSLRTDMVLLNMGIFQKTEAEGHEPICGCPASIKPVVLIKDKPSDKSRTDLFGSNIVGEIRRPFRKDSLLEMIQRHLAGNLPGIQ